MAEGKTTKLVDETMCKTCVHKDVIETDEPCHSCMEAATNENSVKPINYIYDERRATNGSN